LLRTKVTRVKLFNGSVLNAGFALALQVRVTGQFEEGQHFNAHLIQVPI
jgi:hypothetical protein